jgi:pimeloyl-ACP methyl ester carboxylesterase
MLLGLWACRTPVTASGGPPHVPSGVPSQYCAGTAPVDDDIKMVPGVRASWFNPSAKERLYVLEAGQRSTKRPSLVLIHGVGAIGTKDFYPVLQALSRTRHVLAVDLPGFGRSNPEDDDFGPERLVQAVDRVVRACGSKTFDVLGHSSGGALSLLFAAHRSDAVRRLVVVDAAGILLPEVLLESQLHMSLNEAREDVPVASKLAERLGQALIDMLHALTPSASALAKSGLIGREPPVLAATALLDYNFGQAIVETKAETLVVWGKEDQVAPARIAHLLDERIEHSELAFLDDAGHVPMKDQPELFASIVSGYLDSGLASIRAHKGLPASVAPNTATRNGQCQDQEDVELEGDYAHIEILRCKRVWLNHVRATHVEVRDSQGRIDSTEISAGLLIEDSQFSLTGGLLQGPVALTVKDSKLDIAGANIVGDQVALEVHGKSEFTFSVTALASPKTAQLLHQEMFPKDGFEM